MGSRLSLRPAGSASPRPVVDQRPGAEQPFTITRDDESSPADLARTDAAPRDDDRGFDSGGSAGLQADMRTFAMLGVHGCAAVTAVTVQNSLGVRAFHEIPVEVVAAQISAVASDIGIEAAKTGMLASTAIIQAIVATWTAEKLTGTVPFVVDPVCASNAGEPLLHPSALDAMRDELIPLATLVTPNLDEVRLLVGIDVTDADTQRDAARALHALGPQWALVKGGHLRTSRVSSDLLFDGSGVPRVRCSAGGHPRRPRRRRHPRRGDHGGAGARLFGSRCGRVRQDVGDRVHPRGLPSVTASVPSTGWPASIAERNLLGVC